MALWKPSSTNTFDNDSMVDEASSETTLIPAELRMIFKLEDDDTMYAMIHSCYDQSHKLSVLVYV